MAYSLRYWYNNKLTDGKVIRLEIYKKDSAAAAMEIGDVVQGLSLNIDGGEDNIDAPIVSTSLVMTFCDAYDHPEADVKKCGNYAEFYTPDATLWKVVLLCKDAGASSFRTLWGGYVTPDSYEEDLTYRGSVTIVARDNIGHMADFPFDAEGDDYGTISFREIIEGAWAKIESPMSLVFHDEWMQTEGVSALDTRMNVSAFEDKSWHEAVEAALYAYGAVLRFIGDNEVKVSPLRYMPNYGGSVTHSEPVFMTGATRMLTPAVKRIEEAASYELEAGAVIPRLEASDYTGEIGTYRFQIKEFGGDFGTTEEIFTAPVWPVQKIGLDGWIGGAAATTLFFNIDAYELSDFAKAQNQEDEIKRYMYIGANNVDFGFVRLYKTFNCSDFAIHIKLGKPISMTDDMKLQQSSSFNLQKIVYRVGMEQNGVTSYFQGGESWAAADTDLTQAFDPSNPVNDIVLPVSMGANIGEAKIFFDILKVEYVQVSNGGTHTGIYACIQSLSFDVPESISLLQTNRVNTNFNEENNVIITRDTAIAPAYNTTFLPSVIKNGIFYAEGLAYKPAKAWAFAGDTPQQMAVYNHLQLLAYYAKPNNVIEGSIVNGDVSQFAHIWQFEGKEHILVSGRYNFINGYIEGAILREFARYENLWGSTGGTQLPATETSNETNVEASASSSSSANTYENITTVSIGMGGGGSSYLRDLLDVDVSASVKGSILCYNGQQWVDKSLDVLLTEMLKLGDWFYKTEDGKSIGTKYNLFSEGEMSANSLNLGGGTSGGGGLIQNVLGKSSFGTVASEDNATTFNAYAIDSLYKRIVELEGKDVEVDLSDYYTKQQTQNAITDALSPYIKATDADGKYAALASFNALQSSFDRLYSALNDDTSGVINTWNEVVDFVNEYSGSEDLSTILGKMNTDINARVKVSDFESWKTDVFNPLSVTVTNLGNKVNDHTDKINKILSWFELREDEDLLITTHNLASYKEISSNGISQGTGGGGSGLISSVLGAGSLGATLTNDNSVVFNAYATNEIYKATQGHASRIGVLESQVGQLTTQGTKVSVSDLLTTGTKIATITVDGVAHEVKGDFLPTSGGTITGTLILNSPNSDYALHFQTGLGAGWIGFQADIERWFVTNRNWSISYTLLHSDNYSQYALPLTGGTIDGNLIVNGNINIQRSSIPLYVTRTTAGSSVVGFYGKDTAISIWGSLGMSAKNNPVYLSSEGTTYPLIHSGNIGEYAMKTDGSNQMNSPLRLATIADLTKETGLYVGQTNISGGAAFDYASFVNIYDRCNSSLQLSWFRNISIPKLVARISENGNWSAWKTIAFTDSNVASATNSTYCANWGTESEHITYDLGTANNTDTWVPVMTQGKMQHRVIPVAYNSAPSTLSVLSATKLTTARTIWGQSFDGTGDVSGNLIYNGETFITNETGFTSFGNMSRITFINGNGIWFNSSGHDVVFSSSGNVIIGTTNDNGEKLQVNGDIRAATLKAAQIELSYTTPFIDFHFNNSTADYTSRIIEWKSGMLTINETLHAKYNGNVGIGTTDPKAKLDVTGTLHASGAVTFGSTLTIAGATTHNGIAYFGGTTYYINTSGNANFNAISGSSLQVDSAAFNGTIHSNEYSGSVAKWSITNDGAASFASLSNGGLLETSTLRVSSTSTFTGKTNHNGGIGATSLSVSGTSTLSGHVGIGTSPHSTYALYVDGSLRCGPIDGGTASFGALYSNTHVPNSNNTYDLGSTSYRWASIYGVGADFSGNVTVNGTLYASGTLYTNDIDGSDIYITASGDLYLHTLTGYVGANNKRWAIDGYGNYKGQSLYINPRDNDNEIITDNNKKKTHGFPREGVAVFVNGDIAATGEISANALNQGSDIRFKHQLGDITLDLDTIANAPMFRFTWTNKENSRVQIGTSAQYWKDSARELVSVDKDDFHRLDYATLGVLIGVTLGKTVKNHEDRIKELETKVESLEAENRRLRYGN